MVRLNLRGKMLIMSIIIGQGADERLLKTFQYYFKGMCRFSTVGTRGGRVFGILYPETWKKSLASVRMI
jgi:hypothetical protein